MATMARNEGSTTTESERLLGLERLIGILRQRKGYTCAFFCLACLPPWLCLWSQRRPTKKAKPMKPVLEATLEHPRKAVAGTDLTVALRLENVSSHPVNLPWPKYIDQFVTSEVTAPDGKLQKVKHSGLALGHGKYPGGDLKPGEALTVQVPHKFAEGGRYQVKCVLETSRKGTPWWNFWEGRVESNPVTIIVTKGKGN